MPKATVKPRREHWKSTPEDHDFPAAHDFLSLVIDEHRAEAIVDRLRSGSLVHRKAKDLLRASDLPLLPVTNAHVAIDLQRVKRGAQLSPVLLVRGELREGVHLTIADGYHRICASYSLDEDADVPCIIVDAEAPDSSTT